MEARDRKCVLSKSKAATEGSHGKAAMKGSNGKAATERQPRKGSHGKAATKAATKGGVSDQLWVGREVEVWQLPVPAAHTPQLCRVPTGLPTRRRRRWYHRRRSGRRHRRRRWLLSQP